MQFRIPVRQSGRALTALIIFILLFSTISLPPVQAQGSQDARLKQFDLLTDAAGWILLNEHVYWTSDAGSTWEQIGPILPSDGSIQDVQFVNAQTGWVLWTVTNPDGSAGLQLDHTQDHGVTWITSPLSLINANEASVQVEKAQMGWFDEQTGWISIKQMSGSNFSIGSLFLTADGGNHWSRAELPVADQVYFSDPQTGWAVGGPGRDQIFSTHDAGDTWQDNRPADLPPDAQTVMYPPWVQSGQGLLVTTTVGMENELNVYSLNNDSATWTPLEQLSLQVQPGVIGLSIFDNREFMAVIPETNSIVSLKNGELHTGRAQQALPGSMVKLDMVSSHAGWVKTVDGVCRTGISTGDPNAPVSCSSTAHLLRTTDGGLSWTELKLPPLQAGTVSRYLAGTPDGVSSLNTNLILENTEVFVGQGFDRCEIPTLSQMQAWSVGGPYRTVNLYIGGSNRACDNNSLTSSYLFQLSQQGWKFIPTWVGPQAPCTGYKTRMSFDVDTAYTEGVDQGNLAVDRLAELGLTDPAKTGSVIYYDIEAYGTDQACRDAVNAFMNGWVSQLKAKGNLAGVYGSTLCDTGLSDFRNITNVPDVIWAARWYHNSGAGFYDPNASVWNLGSCIPNTAWAAHQRIRQYEGDHDETWGGLTLKIDSDVLDGVVAVQYDYPFVSSILRAGLTPTNTATVDFTVSFSKPVTGVNASDFKLTTTGLTGASIKSVAGSDATYTVTVSTGSGDGTIRLDVVDNESIQDASNNPLAGFGTGNGNYSSGETYTVVKSSTFADVPGTYWARDYIERLYKSGITLGCNTSPLWYCPNKPVARDQMAIFLLRGIHSSTYTPPPATGVFQDVPLDYWAADWIEQLSIEGITGGCTESPKQYCPGAAVTRDQMAVFLLRARHGQEYVPPKATGMFEDVPVDYWAADWIEQLATEGITGGCSVTPRLYCPAKEVTRDQMAVFLVKNFSLP